MESPTGAPYGAASLGPRSPSWRCNKTDQSYNSRPSAQRAISTCALISPRSQVVPSLQKNDGWASQRPTRGRRRPKSSSLQPFPPQRDSSLAMAATSKPMKTPGVQANTSNRWVGSCDESRLKVEINVVDSPCSGPLSNGPALAFLSRPTMKLAVKSHMGDRPTIEPFSSRPSTKSHTRGPRRRDKPSFSS